jgi:hypothetical protein
LRALSVIGSTPAVAAGLEEKPWILEQVVEMTQTYWQKKNAI